MRSTRTFSPISMKLYILTKNQISSKVKTIVHVTTFEKLFVTFPKSTYGKFLLLY